jgi:hypothetical protein
LQVQIIFYERFHNWEITAGGVLMRNTNWTQQFLLDWARYEQNVPKGIFPIAAPNGDNGALHLHLMCDGRMCAPLMDLKMSQLRRPHQPRIMVPIETGRTLTPAHTDFASSPHNRVQFSTFKYSQKYIQTCRKCEKLWRTDNYYKLRHVYFCLGCPVCIT